MVLSRRPTIYLLDTDVCVELLRGNRTVIEKRTLANGRVATTWITAAELAYGAAKSRDPRHNGELVEAFLGTVGVFGLDRAAARRFGGLKADLEARGRRLADADLLIAAVALARAAVLVTGNRRHFDRIDGLECADWIRPASWLHQESMPYDADSDGVRG